MWKSINAAQSVVGIHTIMDKYKTGPDVVAWWTSQGATLLQDLIEDGMPKESATTSMLTRRESLAIRFSLDHD